jgi:branched-chain amino acid transport system permease protein
VSTWFKRLRVPLLVLLIVATFPWWLASGQYAQSIATTALIWIAVGIAWNILGGFGGQLSLGHALFFGEGAYGVYLLNHYWGISPWLGLLLVGFVGAVSALPFIIVFRLRGAYFSLATFAIVTVLLDLASSGNSITNGPDGLSLPLVNGGDAPGSFQFANQEVYFFIALALAALAFAVSAWVAHSRLGLRLRAIRDDEGAAAASGVGVLGVKTVTFCLTAFMTAVAGAVYMQVIQFIDPPSAFGYTVITQSVINPMVGGLGTLWGPVLGGGILYPLEQELSNIFPSLPSGAGLAIYGLVVIIIMRLEPGGLLALLSRLARLIERLVRRQFPRREPAPALATAAPDAEPERMPSGRDH